MDSYSTPAAQLLAQGCSGLVDIFDFMFASLPLLFVQIVNGKAIQDGSDVTIAPPKLCTTDVKALNKVADAAESWIQSEVQDSRTMDYPAKLSELKTLLQQPARGSAQPEREFPKLSPSEVRKTVIDLVPDAASWVAPRSGGTKAMDFLVQSYSSGFPALPAAASKHCAAGVRLIVGALADPEAAGLKLGRAKVLARTLAEAYTGCQAVQARTVDMLQGEVRGLTSQSLPAQLRVLVEEYREAALDRMVCHFHPDAPTAGDGTPTMQLPHLGNKYRRHLGSSIGVCGPRMEAAKSDRNASGKLPSSRKLAEEQFWKEFDLQELCQAIVADVNQASDDAERRIDRRLLLEWAGSQPGLGYRVFYDEEELRHYGDMRPSLDQAAMRQPFIYEEFACDVLLSALER